MGSGGVSRGMRVKEVKAKAKGKAKGKGKGKGKALVFYIPFTAAHNDDSFTGSTPRLQSEKEREGLTLPNPTQPNPTQPNPTQPNPTRTCVVFSGMSRSMAMTLSYLYRELVSYCFRWRA